MLRQMSPSATRLHQPALPLTICLFCITFSAVPQQLALLRMEQQTCRLFTTNCHRLSRESDVIQRNGSLQMTSRRTHYMSHILTQYLYATQFLYPLRSLFIASKLVCASWGSECTVQYTHAPAVRSSSNNQRYQLCCNLDRTLYHQMSGYYISRVASLVVYCSESLITNHEVAGSIRGSTVGIFPEGEDSRGDHGLGRSVEFRFKGPPCTTSSYITTHIIGTT